MIAAFEADGPAPTAHAKTSAQIDVFSTSVTHLSYPFSISSVLFLIGQFLIFYFMYAFVIALVYLRAEIKQET